MARIYLIIYCAILVSLLSITPAASILADTFANGLQKTGGTVGYNTKADAQADALPLKIGKIIGYGLAIIGVLFLVLMIYGGYIWLLARGREQEVERAKSIIKNSFIGLIIILGAYAITKIIEIIWMSSKQ